MSIVGGYSTACNKFIYSLTVKYKFDLYREIKGDFTVNFSWSGKSW